MQGAGHAGDGVHGVEAGFHGAVSAGGAGSGFAVFLKGHRGGGGHAVAGENLEGEQAVRALGGQLLLPENGHDVPVGNLLLAVGQLLEAAEGGLQGGAVQGIAQLLGAVGQGMAAAELAQGQALLGNAQILGVHHLIGGSVAEHPVLMNAALVLEGVGAHHGLVGGRLHAAETGDGAADPVDAVGVHGGVAAVVFPAGAQPHDDFLHGGVACAFAQAVDGAFHLPRAAAHPLQGGGHCQAQVVVAMDGQGDRVGSRHLFQHIAEKLPVFLHGGVAHGIGQVDGGGSGADHALHHPVEEFPLGTGGVLQGKLHVVAQLPGQTGGAHGGLIHLVGGHVQLVGHVEGTGGNKHMDALAGSLFEGLAGGFDVRFHAAGQGTYRGTLQFL